MNAPAAISDVIGTTDAEILGRFDRTGGVDFLPLNGAYRVLAHSGDQAAPEAVMVEVAAPMTISSGTRWLFVGGIITWTDDRWQISSIKPTETGQPHERRHAPRRVHRRGPSRRPHRPGMDGVRQRPRLTPALD